jgi:DNA-binding IclR family transcriptional regulator
MMNNDRLVFGRLHDDETSALRILAWIRNGHERFGRQQVAGLRIPKTTEALSRLEDLGYLRRDYRLKRYYATPRALEENA